MRVLVLHSDVPPDAPADEQDTLIQAGEIADALREGGHRAACAAFVPDKEGFRALVANARPDAIFNVVESVWAEGKLASVGATFLAASGVPYTGAAAAPMATTADKVLTKRLLAAAGVATAPWSEPPRWDGLAAAERWIVKSIDEDASLGLDDGAVVSRHDVAQRANISAAQHGGRWFAEAFIDGREFNVAVLEDKGSPRVLPIAEMRFENWRGGRPKIVGYEAKWNRENPDFHNTVRDFTWAKREPELRDALTGAAVTCWRLFGLSGYARVDFRVGADGRPLVLEVNVNPCLSQDAGFAAAATQADMAYPDLVQTILRSAHR